ncbi:hypothetical protein HZA73_10670 [candidate division TA06 bacterium]|nr:hypothetical protein [candidate division TA06 bacterium]
MDKVDFMLYRGVRILVLDVSHSKSVDENIAAFQEAQRIISREPSKSVRLLTDVTQAHYTTQAVDAMKEFSKASTPYIKASATVGVTGIKRVIVHSLIKLTGRHIEIFGDREKALDWLAGQL